MAVTPTPGTVTVVAAGGTPVVVIPAGINGGIITNPLLASDQSVSSAEPLYVNPISNAALHGYGTTFALQPGQSWDVIPGQTTQTTVNATTGGHTFTAVYW